MDNNENLQMFLKVMPYRDSIQMSLYLIYIYRFFKF